MAGKYILIAVTLSLIGCSAASYTKTNRPNGGTVTHAQVMPGATLKYEPVTGDLCLSAASVGGECECKTISDDK